MYDTMVNLCIKEFYNSNRQIHMISNAKWITLSCNCRHFNAQSSFILACTMARLTYNGSLIGNYHEYKYHARTSDIPKITDGPLRHLSGIENNWRCFYSDVWDRWIFCSQIINMVTFYIIKPRHSGSNHMEYNKSMSIF